MKKSTLVIIAATLGLAACNSASATELRGSGQMERLEVQDAPALESVLSRSRELGYELLGVSEETENVVVSPASLTVALAMLGLGATGDAALEMQDLLGADPAAAADAVNAILGSLSAHEGDPGSFDPERIPEAPFLHLANRIVLDDGFEVEQAYLDALVRSFDAALGQVDLGAPSSKDHLSRWVSEHTAGLIEESAIEPDPDLVIVLQNALLFGARWEHPFEEQDTYADDFTTATGEQITVQTMHGSRSVTYTETDGWKAIRLPYSDGFSAMFVLPPLGTDPAETTADQLASLEDDLSRADEAEVKIALPVLDTRATTDLVTALGDLGYSAIFDESASNFAEIAPDLYVGSATQQTVLRVQEEGTVAAAVTEFGVGDGAAPVPDEPLTFIADHPYLMVIDAPQTGWDLFQAVIRDPRT